MAQEQPPPQLTNGTEDKDVLGQTWELEGVTEVIWSEVAAGEASGDTGSMDCIGSWRKKPGQDKGEAATQWGNWDTGGGGMAGQVWTARPDADPARDPYPGLCCLQG